MLSNHLLEEHYSPKLQYYHHPSKLPYYFVVKLNNYLFFHEGIILSYNYIHTNQEFFDLCAIYDAVNVDEPIKTTFPQEITYIISQTFSFRFLLNK